MSHRCRAPIPRLSPNRPRAGIGFGLRIISPHRLWPELVSLSVLFAHLAMPGNPITALRTPAPVINPLGNRCHQIAHPRVNPSIILTPIPQHAWFRNQWPNRRTAIRFGFQRRIFKYAFLRLPGLASSRPAFSGLSKRSRHRPPPCRRSMPPVSPVPFLIFRFQL